MTNLPISSLRYYDKEGFFPNLEKQSGIRRFSQAELDANEQKLLDGEKEIRENEQKLKDAKKDLEDAKKKFVGPNPNILALPKTYKIGAVHLCMKNEGYDGTCGHPCAD